MRNLRLLSLGVSALLLLSACLGGGSTSIPQDHYYRLPRNKPVEVLAKPVLQGSVAVMQLQSHGLYRDRSMLFIETATPLEVQRYHYHHWTESPPLLIQENLVHYLRHKQAARRVMRYRPGTPADFYISGRINQYERVIDDGNPGVTVTLELELQSSQQKPLWRREYTHSLAVANMDMHATVQAFGEVLTQIYEQFLADIKLHTPDLAPQDNNRSAQ